jgi:hypothetical protein
MGLFVLWRGLGLRGVDVFLMHCGRGNGGRCGGEVVYMRCTLGRGLVNGVVSCSTLPLAASIAE